MPYRSALLHHPASMPDNNAKQHQIIHGAHTIFMARGFDATSMDEIAKAAGVSKGTLYTYFKDKNTLFNAIVEKESLLQAERIFDFELDNSNIEATLTRVSIAFAKALCTPDRQSPIRAVIAVADRMPAIGQMFYKTGPALGIAKISAYLEVQVAAGRLTIPDCALAAAQLLAACKATLLSPCCSNFAPPPPQKRIEYVVRLP